MNLPRSLYNTDSEIEIYCKDIDLLALDFRESLHEDSYRHLYRRDQPLRAFTIPFTLGRWRNP
jgi:hypothetical protein